MITLQKWVGGITAAFAAWTIVANIIFFRGEMSLLSIILAAISLVLFVASIFIDKTWMRVFQVICIAIVSVFSIMSEPDRILDVIAGCFFMQASVALALSYDLFDKNPVPIIIISILSLTFAFSISAANVATGGAIAFAFTCCFAILWAIIHVKIKRLQELATRGFELAKRRAESEEKNG